jgi:uroporphyrinogen III methyltransferase/synthase
LIAYSTVSKKLKKEKLDKIVNQNFDGIIFTSGSNVESFYKNLVDNNFNIDEVIQNKKIISIGPSTTKVLNKYNIKIDIEAKDYSIKGIADII